MRTKIFLLSILTCLTLLPVGANAGTNAYPVPPSRQHPRLYLLAEDIPGLRIKMQLPQGKEILRKLDSLSVPRTPEEEAAETDRGYRYYFKMRGVTSEAQLLALDYLTTGNAASADKAIESMLDTLKRTSFGTKKDLSRASGAMLMVGAVVYDWCYDRMDSLTKQAYIKEFIRIAGMMECKYPPKKTEVVAGHCCEWMVLRDMLSAGIAVYDEYPDMYEHVIKLLMEEYVPVRNYFFKGRNYHQGTSYINVRLSNDLIANWIMTRMGAGPIFSEDLHYVIYDLLYRTRPDALVLPSGDCNPGERGKTQNHSLMAMLAASYYNDPYIQRIYEKRPIMENHCLLLELLWRDFDLKGKDPDDLPLTNYSPTPYGWMVARTDWGPDCVIAEMKINEQFAGNHQHLDAGSFQIYHKGPLAIDTGAYQGSSGGYNSPHSKNYFKRTIAHNSLLIYDPGETFECWSYGGEGKTKAADNDGGQRLPGDRWETCRNFSQLLSESFTYGKECSHWIGEGWSYLKGDITKAYSSKVREVKRSFAFLSTGEKDIPAVMVVCDRIVSSDPGFRKYFLLHSIEEPGIRGNTYCVRRTLNGDSGMLHCTCLLPEKAEISKVGGPGKEFWVFGKNYPNVRKDAAGEMGAWRIEICPGKEREEDMFLNVLQVGDNSVRRYPQALKIESASAIGAVFGKNAVIFSRNLGTEREMTFSLPKGGTRKVLITDLQEGSWVLHHPSGREESFLVRQGENIIHLPSARSGEYRLELISRIALSSSR